MKTFIVEDECPRCGCRVWPACPMCGCDVSISDPPKTNMPTNPTWPNQCTQVNEINRGPSMEKAYRTVGTQPDFVSNNLSDIPRAIADLEGCVSNLEKAVEELLTRLSPVLLKAPAPERMQGAECSKDISCAVGESIRVQVCRIGSQIERIQDTRERLGV